MATLENLRPRERMENSWYDLIAGQLQVLIPKFGLANTSVRLYRAYELICRASLGGHSAGLTTRSSTLNHDGTPIQFSLALGRQAPPLQFLSEAINPTLSCIETGEFLEETMRKLAALLQLDGDLDSVAAVIRRATAVNAYELDPDRGGTCWIGASFTPGGKSGIKIYINGKNGAENERWSKLDDFAASFGAFEKHQEVRRLLAGKMTPLGMAVWRVRRKLQTAGSISPDTGTPFSIIATCFGILVASDTPTRSGNIQKRFWKKIVSIQHTRSSSRPALVQARNGLQI